MGTTEYTTLYHQHTVNNKYLYICTQCNMQFFCIAILNGQH